MRKLNDFTGLLCVAILALMAYQMFVGNKGTTTASFLGRRK